MKPTLPSAQRRKEEKMKRHTRSLKISGKKMQVRMGWHRFIWREPGFRAWNCALVLDFLNGGVEIKLFLLKIVTLGNSPSGGMLSQVRDQLLSSLSKAWNILNFGWRLWSLLKSSLIFFFFFFATYQSKEDSTPDFIRRMTFVERNFIQELFRGFLAPRSKPQAILTCPAPPEGRPRDP